MVRKTYLEKGLCFSQVKQEGKGQCMPEKGQLHSIEKSRQLQCKLYLAAKKDKQRRFHALYDRIFRLDILWREWKEVRENKGSAGIDGVTFEMIDEYGVESYLLDIQEDLMKGVYQPSPVKRVYIPKPDGKQRPLGILVIRDRIIQQACKIVVEPIFEANFMKCSYGFRPKRDAVQASKRVQKALNKNWYIVDSDIKGYFDNIDHDILISLLKRRISDRRVLNPIIRGWRNYFGHGNSYKQFMQLDEYMWMKLWRQKYCQRKQYKYRDRVLKEFQQWYKTRKLEFFYTPNKRRYAS